MYMNCEIESGLQYFLIRSVKKGKLYMCIYYYYKMFFYGWLILTDNVQTLNFRFR